jgi:hypothetical protein
VSSCHSIRQVLPPPPSMEVQSVRTLVYLRGMTKLYGVFRVQGLQGVEWSLDPKRKPVGQHLHTTEAHLIRINVWRLSSHTESKSANWPTRVHLSADNLR